MTVQLHQRVLGFGKTKIEKKHTLCLVRVIATRMLEILFSLIMQQIKVDAFTDLKCRKLRGIVT